MQSGTLGDCQGEEIIAKGKGCNLTILRELTSIKRKKEKLFI